MTGSLEGDARLATEELRTVARETNAHLCVVLELLELWDSTRVPYDALVASLPPRVQGWWAYHKQVDTERKARETAHKRQHELSLRAERDRIDAELAALREG